MAEEEDVNEDFLQPVSLDAGESVEGPRGKGRRIWGALLGVLLICFALGWVLMPECESQMEPELPSEAKEETAESGPNPEVVPSLETPTPVPPTPVALEVPLLLLQTDPPGASVLSGGTFLGVTPLELSDWEEGREFQFRLSGYQPHREAAPGRDESAEIRIVLQETTAPVRFSGDLEATRVFVNGKGVSLAQDRILNLPLRESVVRIEKDGFQPWQENVIPTLAYQREVGVSFLPVEVEGEQSEKNEDASAEAVLQNSVGMGMWRPAVPLNVTLGAPRGSPGRKSHEGERRVRLERPFRISVTEVSNETYALFDASHSSGKHGPVNLAASDLPVVGITWAQAARFCNWLSVQEGLVPAYVENEGRWAFDPDPGTGYRLPTEAEWEGLLRSASGTELYPWGSESSPPAGTVNLAGTESRPVVSGTVPNYKDAWPGPGPVGQAFLGTDGLRGMAGNVREWVHDGFTAPVPGGGVRVDPMENSAARFHVIKGAGWMDGQWMDLRVARRRYEEQGAPDLGFRIARYVD